MFTGIIEDIGTVQAIQPGAASIKLKLSSGLILSDLKIGDSIAVNGICLTAATFDATTFTVDVMPETLRKTNLGQLKNGHKVNLERALTLNTRLGGHLVSGHIDATGKITKLTGQGIATVLEIQFPSVLARYLVPKGSVALDGTSLTLVDVTADTFTVSLIPHTRGNTVLGFKKAGDTVNLEVDLLAKYLEKLHAPKEPAEQEEIKPQGLDLSFLSKTGFI